MTQKGKIAAAALAIVSLAPAACGGGGFDKDGGGDQQTKPIKIGVITGLTGPYVTLGTAQRNGAQVAIREMGGRAGEHPISVVVRDDGLQPDAALREAKSLVQAEHVDFLTGCVSAATTLAINQVAKQAGVPYLGTCQTEQLTRPPNADNEVTYHVAPLPSQVISAYMPWLCKNLGKKLYLLIPDYAWGHEQNAAYEQQAKANGCSVAGRAWFPLGTTDFTPYIPRIRGSSADVVLFGGAGRDQVNFMKQARQFDLDERMEIFLNLEDFTFDQEMGFDLLDGTHAATGFYWTVDDPGVQKFVKAYEQTYRAPPSGYAVYVYNAVRLIADAVKENKLTNQAFRTFLEGRRFQYAQGPQSLRACDHQTFQPTYIVEGLSAEEAAQEGRSARWGYRKLAETVPGAEDDAPDCAAAKKRFEPAKPPQ
jgi:branched-chain amino acid transport system substrate-binding protein